METERSKSDRARLNMKMFLAVLISFLLKTAAMINEFPITNRNTVSISATKYPQDTVMYST